MPLQQPPATASSAALMQQVPATASAQVVGSRTDTSDATNNSGRDLGPALPAALFKPKAALATAGDAECELTTEMSSVAAIPEDGDDDDDDNSHLRLTSNPDNDNGEQSPKLAKRSHYGSKPATTAASAIHDDNSAQAGPPQREFSYCAPNDDDDNDDGDGGDAGRDVDKDDDDDDEHDDYLIGDGGLEDGEMDEAEEQWYQAEIEATKAGIAALEQDNTRLISELRAIVDHLGGTQQLLALAPRNN